MAEALERIDVICSGKRLQAYDSFILNVAQATRDALPIDPSGSRFMSAGRIRHVDVTDEWPAISD
jgi:hypothetical protein